MERLEGGWSLQRRSIVVKFLLRKKIGFFANKIKATCLTGDR